MVNDDAVLLLWLWSAYWIGRCLAGAVRWWLAACDLRALQEIITRRDGAA